MKIVWVVVLAVLLSAMLGGGLAAAADGDDEPVDGGSVMRKWADYGALPGGFDLRPDDFILREEAARILSAIIEYDTGPDAGSLMAFPDVGEDSPHYGYVKIAVLTGVMSGPVNGGFGIGEIMTREQAAVVLYRVFAAYLDAGNTGRFSDLWQSSSWAGGSVSVLAGNGIINGYPDGSFRPHSCITRLEFITMLDRLMPVPGIIKVVLPDPADIPDFDRTDPNPPPPDPYAHLRDKKLIALTFDDGPYRTQTTRVLDELAAKGVKATFFMTGNRALGWPDTVRRVVDEGHQLANHSFSHKNLARMTAESIQWEIEYTNDLFEQIAGVRSTVMRPPLGSFTDRVRSAVGMPLIMWSIDPQDWDGKSTDYIVNFVTSRARDGDIILLHDPVSASIRATPRIIDKLHQDGFTFVTIDELIAVRGGAEAGTAYYRFR